MEREARIAQEFGMCDFESMLVSRFVYLSDKVTDIWEKRAKAVEEGKVYIGG